MPLQPVHPVPDRPTASHTQLPLADEARAFLAVEAAAIRFLAVWRASLAGNPKAWLAEATAAEKELVEALRARGVNVEAALREARGGGRRS